MAESFSVTRRFFDDKNYPRGFARHGDYTIREAQTLEQFGQACLALESGERSPVTAEEERFVAVMKGNEIAESIIAKPNVFIPFRVMRAMMPVMISVRLNNRYF